MIGEALRDYASNVEAELKDAARLTAAEAVKALEAASPKETGEYAESWTSKEKKRADGIQISVYNTKPIPLETGHAKVSGGRVAPIIHIEPVAQTVEAQLQQRIEEAIRTT